MAEAKRQKLDPSAQGDAEEDSELPQELEVLRELQAELAEINEQASEAVLRVEQEYNKKRKPVYQRRADAISNVPNFWFTTLCQHPWISENMSPADRDILSSLEQITVEDSDDVKSGFQVTFAFAENPFFSDKQIVKRYKYSEDATVTMTTSPVQWRDGKDIRLEEAGSLEVPEDKFPFFSWLLMEGTDLPVPPQDEFMEAIREDIWPNPMSMYLGVLSENDLLGEIAVDFDADEGEDDQGGEEEVEVDGEDGDEAE